MSRCRGKGHSRKLSCFGSTAGQDCTVKKTPEWHKQVFIRLSTAVTCFATVRCAQPSRNFNWLRHQLGWHDACSSMGAFGGRSGLPGKRGPRRKRKAQNLGRGRRTRESTSGRRRLIPRGLSKAVGGEGAKSSLAVWEGEPEEGKAQEGIGRTRPKPPRTATDSGAEQGPEGVSNDKRARAGDEPVRLRRRGNPWRANPGRGCGVKQTHEAGGGGSRRGREKRRGRN